MALKRTRINSNDRLVKNSNNHPISSMWKIINSHRKNTIKTENNISAQNFNNYFVYFKNIKRYIKRCSGSCLAKLRFTLYIKSKTIDILVFLGIFSDFFFYKMVCICKYEIVYKKMISFINIFEFKVKKFLFSVYSKLNKQILEPFI